MNDHYQWRGGSEYMLRHGTGSPLTLLVIPALFEEANRMRRITVSAMRFLADLGIGTVLPDLPGTGESLKDSAEVSLQDWKDAIAALADGVWGSVAIRGGALLDGIFDNRWRLAPDTGERLLRDMVRATCFSANISVEDLAEKCRSTPTRLAGNLINPALYTALHDAVPMGQAHIMPVAGQKLWRAAEPGDDPDFARAIAHDILAWTKTCAR